jgi:hypothetical protein
MYFFSKTSKLNLGTCRKELQDSANLAIQILDFGVSCGQRGEADQNKAFAEKKSKVKFPNSKHNKIPSDAFDFFPAPLDWSDVQRFIYVGGVIIACGAVLGHDLRWGGDWNENGIIKDESFKDFPHIEYKGPLKGIILPT